MVIYYLTLKNVSVAEMAIERQDVYGTDALQYATVSKWRLRFQDGSDGLLDLARSEMPSRSDFAVLFSHYYSNFHSSCVKYFATK
jgi:hypothetical protein